MKSPTLSIVICGWYFGNQRLYQAIQREVENSKELAFELYITSHKPKEEIEPVLARKLQDAGWRILHFENEGWEWGAYQQFLRHQKNIEKFTDYYLFLHDDVHIIKAGFVNAFLRTIKSGAYLVGNSPSVAPEKQNKCRFPEDALLIEKNRGALIIEQWKVVRGSCFFTTREIACEILAKMPIKKGRRIELANSSLRIFGALVTDRYGLNAIQYLGETPRQSEYIFEEFRGGKKEFNLKRYLPTSFKKVLKNLYYGRKLAPIRPGSGLRINLGCGRDPLPGYFNIDFTAPDNLKTGQQSELSCQPTEALYFNAYYADLNTNILELDFNERSLAEIMMIHVIEHLNYRDVEPLLLRFHRWLKPEGHLILEFPDVIKVSRLLLKIKNDSKSLRESPYGLRGLYGGHTSPRGHEHRWGWTGSTMTEILRKVGFEKVYVERAQFHQPRRDTRVRAVK